MKIVSIANGNNNGNIMDAFNIHNNKSVDGLNRIYSDDYITNIFIHDYEDINTKSFDGTDRKPINIPHMIFDVFNGVGRSVGVSLAITTKLMVDDGSAAKVSMVETGFSYTLPDTGMAEDEKSKLQSELSRRLNEIDCVPILYSRFEYNCQHSTISVNGIKVYIRDDKGDIYHVYIAISAGYNTVSIKYNITDFLHPFNTIFNKKLNIVCDCDIDEIHQCIFKEYIPANLTVLGKLILTRKHTYLPKTLNVESIYAKNIGLSCIPDDIKIGCTADFSGNELTEVPEGLAVRCDLILSKNNITKLPRYLFVGNSLYIDHNKLTEFEVRGVCRSIYASYNEINAVEIGLNVGCDLDLSNNKLITLRGLKVTGSLKVSHNKSLYRISNIYVGVDLDAGTETGSLNTLSEVIVKGICSIGKSVKVIDGDESVSYIGTLIHYGDEITPIKCVGVVHVKKDMNNILWETKNIEEVEKNEDINGRE